MGGHAQVTEDNDCHFQCPKNYQCLCKNESLKNRHFKSNIKYFREVKMYKCPGLSYSSPTPYIVSIRKAHYELLSISISQWYSVIAKTLGDLRM